MALLVFIFNTHRLTKSADTNFSASKTGRSPRSAKEPLITGWQKPSRFGAAGKWPIGQSRWPSLLAFPRHNRPFSSSSLQGVGETSVVIGLIIGFCYTFSTARVSNLIGSLKFRRKFSCLSLLKMADFYSVVKVGQIVIIFMTARCPK